MRRSTRVIGRVNVGLAARVQVDACGGCCCNPSPYGQEGEERGDLCLPGSARQRPELQSSWGQIRPLMGGGALADAGDLEVTAGGIWNTAGVYMLHETE